MANQSSISIPTDLTDTTALRRVLTSVVAQIDTIKGSRTGSENAYVTQSQLSSSASTAAKAIAAVEAARATTTQSIEQVSSDVSDLSDQVSTNTEDITSLEQLVADIDSRLADIESGVVEEAPTDGGYYVRRNGAWEDISSWAP